MTTSFVSAVAFIAIWVGVTALLSHLNTAWNARDASKAATDECSQENFIRWRQFPTEDIYLGA
jgi:hypothetical protein